MIPYKHILLATDLTGDSELIANRAKEIADGVKAELSIIHVVENTPVVYGGGEFSIPIDINLEEKLVEQARQAMVRLGERFNVPLERQYVEIGSAKKIIADMAEQLGVDLIIAGTHGRYGWEVLLGSTANAILHIAKCDVLVVRLPRES
jgi:universal stress protein A